MEKIDLKSECGLPHANNPLWSGPAFSRRQFFRIAGTGVAGYYLTQVASPLDVLAQSRVATRSTARQCILIHLAGAPSHVDMFDLKEGPWTPIDFAPTGYGNIRFPKGLMPNLAEQLGHLAIIRSSRSWALVHSLTTIWMQIARNPVAALGKISPNIGSVVALEYQARRKPQDLLPGFISLNATPVGSGYFPTQFAPFQVATSASGLTNTTNADGATRLGTRWQLLQSLDGEWRNNSPVGRAPEDMQDFYLSAKALMYNSQVDSVFKFTTDDRNRFGASGFGDSCLVARNILKNDLGTRFIQISLGGWDNHSTIYNQTAGIYPRAQQLDKGLAMLLSDLSITPGSVANKSLLDETLIVVMGEFGRTVGNLNAQQGRDHFMQQFVVMAGGGVAGGRVIGATDATGSRTAEPGWAGNRDVRPEDVAATIYSALGIDWTTTRYDDPFKRGFDYVPFAKDGAYMPIDEVFK